MITAPVLQWAFTVLFIAVAVHFAWSAVVERRTPLRVIGHVLHVLMALDMVAMAWPWWSAIPWLPQLVLFAAATLWFAALAILQWTGRLRPANLGGHTAWFQVVHVVMMAAMAWMVAAMPPGASDGHGDMHGEHAMAMLPPLTHGIGVGITAALLVTAGVELGAAVRRHHPANGSGLGRADGHGRTEGWAIIAMLLGMAAMNWSMLAG